MRKILSKGLNIAIQTVIDTVLPMRCPSCSEIIAHGQTNNAQSGFCSSCWPQLKFITPPWCSSCAKPFKYNIESESQRQCVACLESPPVHDGIRAALIYDDIPSNVILKLKYSGRIAIAQLIAEHLRRFLKDDVMLLDGDIWITPVPLHWTRLYKRTYNQSALIGDALCKGEPLYHNVDLLKRIRKTPSLAGANGKKRRHLLKSAIALNSKYIDAIKGRSIILIDDVYTSGATTDACVKTLKAAGADKVVIYCWTRVLDL